jgi:hypothetical protein
MKTKNNVQKTVLRSAAVVASFVLISFTVAAQDFWKTVLTNSSFNQIALAMVETPKKADVPASSSNANHAINIYENEYDSKMAVENWMTSNNYFKPIVIQQVDKESNLQVEEWMFNKNLFVVADETESPLALENWMTSNEVWKN